jgi:site-specific DNA recombinase
MQAVAYIRVSSDEQINNTSLDSQRKNCLEYAKRSNIRLEPDCIFREEGVSAKLSNRPELAKLLDYCTKNKGRITHCIVYKVDRLARSSELHHVIKAALAKNGVKLVSVTEPIDDSPTGSLMDSMLAAFAQFDNEIRLLRTQGGMRARSEQGGWPHDAPTGYIKNRTASGASSIKPDPERAELVTKLLREFATGSYSVKQLMELAYKQGLRSRSGNKRNWQSIKNMLENPIYAGYVRSKFTDGKMVKGLHEALIDDRTYYRNQSILSGQVKNFSRQSEIDWPLRGGFIKHTCGKPMTGSSPKGQSGPSPRYSCIHCRASVLGKKVSTPRHKVHDDFIALLESVRPSEGVNKLFKEIVLKKWNVEFKDAVEHGSKIDNEIAAWQSKKSRILDLYIENNLSDAEKRQKLDEADKAITQLEMQRVDAGQYIKDRENIIDAALLFMDDPSAFWNVGGLQVKRRVQDLIFPEGLTYDCMDGFRTAKLNNSYLLMKNIAHVSDKNPNVVAMSGLEPVTPSL